MRRQEDGDELDLDAYIEFHADLRAGRPTRQAIYQTQRAARRDAAIMVLVDVSGSTDSWVSEKRRVIDVEKEALTWLRRLGEQAIRSSCVVFG